MQEDPNVAAIVAKYREICERGRQGYSAGTLRPFPGFARTLARRVSLVVRFDSAGAGAIGHLFEQMETSPELLSIQAGRDYPLHTTALEAEGRNEAESDPFVAAFARFAKGFAEGMLSGLVISFDQLIADGGGSVILAARTIQPEIREVRSRLQELYASQGLTPLALEHILHATILRVTALPNEELHRREMLQRFHTRIEELNAELETRPIEVVIQSAELVQTYEFLTRKI